MATSRRNVRAAVAQPDDDAPVARRPAGRSAVTGRPGAGRAVATATNYRGAAGLRKMEEEQKNAEARREAAKATAGAPFRYFTPVGDTREVVIVDEAPSMFRWEHALQDKRSKRWDHFTPCIDEHANCPVCAVAERPAYFAMYLTIIDLTPFTTGQGEEVEFSKKLLVVKTMQQKKIMRLYDRHKSLRGMVITLTRDTDKDAAIGNDIEFVEFMDEEELATYQTSYTDKDGKQHDIDCSVPYDYDEIFPEMTETQLRAIAGGKPDAGSRADTDRALGRGARDNASNWDDGDTNDAPTRRTASRRDAPAAPARPARGAAPARPARGARDDVQDDGQDDDQGPPFDDSNDDNVPAAPARRPARGSRAAPVDDAPQRGRVARRAPEPEQSRAPAGNVAARRAALRR